MPLGTFRTDEKGTILVLAPLVALYLDGITYFDDQGKGPAGVAYSYNSGLKLGSEETLVLKKAWELNEDDYLLDDFEIHVFTNTGAPQKNIELSLSWRTNTCGGGDVIGKTDSHGKAQIELIPQIVTSIKLTRPDGQTRDLTDGELRQLFIQHRLTIQW